MPSTTHRHDLNTVAARNNLQVAYEDTFTGPKNDPTWKSIVYVNQIEYGQATASTKAGARELAAKQAIDAIMAPQA